MKTLLTTCPQMKAKSETTASQLPSTPKFSRIYSGQGKFYSPATTRSNNKKNRRIRASKVNKRSKQNKRSIT